MADEIKKEVTETAGAAKKDKSSKSAKTEKSAKPAKKKNEANIFVRMGKRIKKFFKDEKGECKKVVWPSGKTVLKSTGVVLAVTAVVGIAIYGIDTGLSELLKLLLNFAENSGSDETTTAAAGMIFALLGR